MGVSRPLTVAHVNAESGFSGGEVQVFLLLEGLANDGYAPVLFCPPGSESEGEARRRGLPVHPVPMRNDLDLAGLRALRRGLRTVRPELVHLHAGRASWLGGLAARLAGIPALSTRRQDRRMRPGPKIRLTHRWLVRRTVAISEAVRGRLLDAGVEAGRVTVIPSAVDPRALRPAAGREATRAALDLAPDEPVALTLAALFHRKGLDVLLDALARLPRAPTLLVAGDGPERGALEARARRLGLERVRFLGRRSDRAELLAACDLLVLPSRLEGLGVAALEAMAAGRAVVASRVGGLREVVVDGRTGLLVPPEDPAALASALARLVEDPAERARLGAAGPERVGEGFLADQMVKSYEELYHELLEGRAA